MLMVNRLAENKIMALLFVLVALIAAACTNIAVGGPALTPTPNGVQATPVATPATPIAGGPRNTLAISEPLPGTAITNQVTVKGEGMAFENTIIVEVLSHGTMLGRTIVTTEAEIGQVGEFTTTVTFTPVPADTSGEVTIYTVSAKDGNVDQRASVPVRLLAPGSVPPTRIYISNPNIRISPARGRPGTEITVVGGGFKGASEVQIRLGGLNSGATSQVYATTRAGEHGNIQVSFIMPDRWPNGEPIVLPQVVVLASSPDFVDKATAQFTLDIAAIVPVTPTPKE
jgi:hypothetical protein